MVRDAGETGRNSGGKFVFLLWKATFLSESRIPDSLVKFAFLGVIDVAIHYRIRFVVYICDV